MELFRAKSGWRRTKKREDKNYRSVPTRLLIENSKKNSKNIQEIKKNTIVASFQAEIGWKRLKKRKIKIIVPFRSDPTRNIKFQKNSQKIQNIKNYQYGNISGGNRLEKDVNEIK